MLPYTDVILYTCGSVMPCDAALHWCYIIYLQQRYAMWCCLTLMIYYIPAAALCHVMLPYTDVILYTCSSVMPCDAALHWWYITVQITFIFIGQTHLVFGKRVCTCVMKHSNAFRTFLNWLKNSKRVWHERKLHIMRVPLFANFDRWSLSVGCV